VPSSPSEPVDIDARLADPKTYEDTILRIFAKKSQRGQAFKEAGAGVSYFGTASQRQSLAKVLARTVIGGDYRSQPVHLWLLDTGGKIREAHLPVFVDHVVGSALYQLLSHNARCYGLPGVYSYLPGLTNVSAMQALAAFIRTHRVGGAPVHILQTDFAKYGDNLPVGPRAALWNTLRDIASLGGPVRPATWEMIVSLVRPVVQDAEGAQFTRLRGVAMGTPLVPLIGNIAVVPMDRAITEIDGVFYARYNDDILIAHPDPAALREADARIDGLLDTLGVQRKLAKEERTALSATGRPSDRDPAYRGRDRIECLGFTVTHAGTLAPAPHRLRRFVGRITTRIDAATPALSALAAAERARHLVAATNVMLDASSPFAVAGLSAVLDATTDRGALKDLDFRIARKIVQAATGWPGVRGFRTIPPRMLYDDLGLVSLVRLRNSA
jgi:hypothetical protein